MTALIDDMENQDELLALLAWWRVAGVDVALSETPIDWTGRNEAPGAGFQWPAAPQPATPQSPIASIAPVSAPKAAGAPTDQRRPEVRRPASSQPSAAPPMTPRPTLVASSPQGGAQGGAQREAQGGAQGAQNPPSRLYPATTPDAAVMAARAAAGRAATLEALEVELKSFDGCGLKATAKSLCFYRGCPQARLMIIGEAPGSDEDRAGKPFVGPSGQLLDKMLAAIGLGEADVHITNSVYWRPPGNRTPTPQETLVCRPFLDRQIELVGPDIILTLGGPATAAILGQSEGILKVRGKWRELAAGDARIRVMPSLHPAYLLRMPGAKRQAWRDLLAIKAALSGASDT